MRQHPHAVTQREMQLQQRANKCVVTTCQRSVQCPCAASSVFGVRGIKQTASELRLGDLPDRLHHMQASPWFGHPGPTSTADK